MTSPILLWAMLRCWQGLLFLEVVI